MTWREEQMLAESGAAGRTPLPRLQPYVRCPCGTCRECRDNAKWDRVFAKFEVKDHGDERGMFRSPLSDL
jgi:hypothetical protein